MKCPVTIVHVQGRRLHMAVDANGNVLGMEQRQSAMPGSRPVRLAITPHRQRLEGDTFHVGAPVIAALITRAYAAGKCRTQWSFAREMARWFPGDPLCREMTRATVRAVHGLPAFGDSAYYKHLAADQMARWSAAMDAMEVARHADH